MELSFAAGYGGAGLAASTTQAEPPPIYRPRQPRATPLYQLFEAHYEEVKALWEERFEKTYGYWRGFTDTVVARYLDCGTPETGFARLRCENCQGELLLSFSCGQRGICPSCDAKRAAAFGAFLLDTSALTAIYDTLRLAGYPRPRPVPKLDRMLHRIRSLASVRATVRRALALQT